MRSFVFCCVAIYSFADFSAARPEPPDFTCATYLKVGTYKTTRLNFRPLRASDDSMLLAMAGEGEESLSEASRKLSADQRAQNFMGIAFRNYPTEKWNHLVFAVVDRESNRVAGYFQFFRSHHSCAARISYGLLPVFRGRGYMREAVAKLLEYGFTELGLEEIFADTVVSNDKSADVVLACGFTPFGPPRPGKFTEQTYRRNAPAISLEP